MGVALPLAHFGAKGKPIERWGRKTSGLTAPQPTTAELPGNLSRLSVIGPTTPGS